MRRDGVITRFLSIALVLLMTSAILGGLGKAAGPEKALASSSKDNIITNEEYRDYQSMSLSQIQSFLEEWNSCLATYRTTDWVGVERSASEIIFNASQDYQYYYINAKVILTKLQQEQGLITTSPGQQSTYQLEHAMGYSDPNCYGFGKQVDAGTWQLDKNFKDIQANGNKNGWGVGIVKQTQDGVAITPQNIATACLYAYTPYAGAGWGGSGGGNYLFWDVYYNMFEFGSTPSNQYILTSSVIPSGGGSISLNPSGGTYDEGTPVTLTPDAASGYRFVHWGGPATSGWTVSQQQQKPISIIMDGNKSISANFENLTINVNSPNGGENWEVGSTHDITWSVSGDTSNIDYFKVAYSTQGGADDYPYDLTPLGLPSTSRSLSWTIPDNVSSQCRVRVRAIDAEIWILDEDISNSNFTISAPPTGQITVTSPNGGESWPVGRQRTISWTSSDVSGNVRIDLSRNGGSGWETIIANTANDGSEELTVTGPTTNQARVRVVSLNNTSISDTSNANFTIFEVEITVTSPNGGESWTAGNSYSITWSASGSTSYINYFWVKYSLDGGNSWTNIDTVSAGTRSCSWSIPSGISSSQCRVMVRALDASGWIHDEDISNSNFTITTPLTGAIHGIDVSHHQGGINWAEVYNAGYRFAFAKATEGDHEPPQYIDEQFIANMTEGRNAGMLMGAYHFAWPQYNNAVDEAQFFISVAGDYITEGYLRPVLDLEQGEELDEETLSNWVHAWMQTVESETGVEPIIYVNSDYAKNYLGSSINQYDLWIALWRCDTDTPPSSEDMGIWDDWSFWQYYGPSYCGNNSVPGITGNVDLNVFSGDMADLQTFVIGSNGYPIVESFNVEPRSLSLGEQVNISYTVSAIGSGLKQVELWRATDTDGDGEPDWPDNPIDIQSLSGQTYSGSFSDQPASADTYWYGIHVVDENGIWNDEQNSFSGGSPGDFGPISVEVITDQSPQLSDGYVEPGNGTPSTDFYYYVTYFNPDGDSPTIKQVYIDGNAYDMDWYQGLNSHITYRFGPKNLSAGGTHYYFFYFGDEDGDSVRLPSGINMFLGPTVSETNHTPDQPSNTSPTDGSTVNLTPTLVSSIFSDPDTEDTHAASQWQVTTSPGNYTSPPLDSGETATNLTSISVPFGNLTYSTTYYWRVRHKDNHGAWSDWSAETSFSTEQRGSISGHVYQADGTTPIVDAIVVAFEIVPGYAASWAEISGNIEQLEQSGSWLPSQIPIPLPEKSAGWSYLDVEIGELDSAFNQTVAMLPPSQTPSMTFVSTASDGSYTISGLLTGIYRVRAEAEGYVREYYQETHRYSGATPVSVTASDNTPNIDFTLDLGGTISGHVYQSDGVTPIAGAWVHASLMDGDYGMGANTASDGSYTITGLPSGPYHVEVQAEGYVREYYRETYRYDEATLVSVNLPDDTPNIDFTLDFGGTISGHVYQPDGVTPIAGAWVHARDSNTDVYGCGWTASDGSYAITGLLTGEYWVESYAEGYIREYYDGVYDWDEATLVNVTMPENTPDIDFTLDVGATISGHVYRSDGVTPMAGAWIYASLVDGGYGEGTETASDGSYTVTGLPSGQYRVEAWAEGYVREYYQETYRYSEATPVSVIVPDDTPNIDFTLDLGGTISGYVYQSDGVTPMADVHVFTWDDNTGVYGYGWTASDGSYTLRGLLTGEYWVEAYTEGYIREYYQETYRHDEATSVSVTMPDNTPNIDFTLDLGGTISGHVYQSDGVAPIAGAWVDADLVEGGYGEGTETDSDGSYTISGLLTGIYRVEADAESYVREYYDGVYDWDEATSVSVTMPNDTPNIDFSLDLGGTISGHVYQSDGVTPIAGAWVHANLVEGGYGEGTETDSDGSYTINGLLTGEYRVEADAESYVREYYDGVYDWDEATPVSVTMPDDTPNIDFALDGVTAPGVTRELPTLVWKGQTFNVTITFTAPVDDFNSIGLSDFAPDGWAVTVNTAWCTPVPWQSLAADNRAQYVWTDIYSVGTPFTAVYQVTVPAGTEPGTYDFTNGVLEYYIGEKPDSFTVDVTGEYQVEVVEDAVIEGLTYEVKGVILGGVTITLDGATSVVSDSEGVYQIIASTTGEHSVVASKALFRSQTRTVNITEIGTTYTLDFKAGYGLVPNTPNLSYVLACIHKWKFPPEGLGLTLSKVLSVIHAWKFPI